MLRRNNKFGEHTLLHMYVIRYVPQTCMYMYTSCLQSQIGQAEQAHKYFFVLKKHNTFGVVSRIFCATTFFNNHTAWCFVYFQQKKGFICSNLFSVCIFTAYLSGRKNTPSLVGGCILSSKVASRECPARRADAAACRAPASHSVPALQRARTIAVSTCPAALATIWKVNDIK